MRIRHALLILATLGLVGCNLLSPRPPVDPRFFYPPVEAPELAAKTPEVMIRVGRVTAAPYLRDRLVLRLSDVEVTHDEQDRWAAPPDLLTERCVYRVFSRANGFVLSESPNASILDLYVLQFESLAGKKSVQVALAATVQCRSTGEVHVRRVDSAVPIPEETPSAIARGMGKALGAAIAELANWARTLPLETRVAAK